MSSRLQTALTAIVASCVTLAAGVVTAAQNTTAQDFGVRHQPTQLVTLVDEDVAEPEAALCATLAAQLRAALDGPAADVSAEALPVVKSHALAWGEPQVIADAPGMTLRRLDVDLDGTGTRQVVLNWTVPTRNRNAYEAEVFADSQVFGKLRDQVLDLQRRRIPIDQVPPGEARYYPIGQTRQHEEAGTGSSWTDHVLFEWQHRYFFVSDGGLDALQLGGQIFPVEPGGGELLVFRLHADGTVGVSCKIQQRGIPRAYKALQQRPQIGAFLRVMQRIGDRVDSVLSCTEIERESGDDHDARASEAQKRAAYRPWAASAATASLEFSWGERVRADLTALTALAGDRVDGSVKLRRSQASVPYYAYDARTQQFLEAWSLQDLWSRREYQALLELIGPAQGSDAAYLESEFGVPDGAARQDAVRVIEALIGSRLQLPQLYGTKDSPEYFPSDPIHRAVMHRDTTALVAALADRQLRSTATEHTRKATLDAISAALEDAVEWPDGLERLLRSGADPSHRDRIGKTPLMVAAHMNRLDAVRTLLRAGADVNAATPRHADDTSCVPAPPQRTGRTALMYAAENASPVVMKLLLDAGAHINVRDSHGLGPDSYLRDNPRLTGEESALGVATVAGLADRFRGPSFECAAAATRVEQSICRSEVLSIFDGEIARALKTLRSREGGSALVQDQEAWLRRRDSSCAPADVDCLAELMRTRIRVLHDWLAQHPSPATAGRKGVGYLLRRVAACTATISAPTRRCYGGRATATGP